MKPCLKGSILNEKNLLPEEQILFFKNLPLFQKGGTNKTDREASQKVYSLTISHLYSGAAKISQLFFAQADWSLVSIYRFSKLHDLLYNERKDFDQTA